MNICVQAFVRTNDLFLLGKYLRMEWLDHMIDGCLTFNNSQIVFQSSCAILLSNQQYNFLSCNVLVLLSIRVMLAS